MKILVTGSAGFIGFHLTKRLLSENFDVIGCDNLNDYYDVSLKEARNKILLESSAYTFHHLDLANYQQLESLFQENEISVVINLAAQAGVRYSIDNPQAYASSNLNGFLNVLECCRHHKIKHLLYASSSSVYGMNKKVPFSEDDAVDHPVSLYAATKKSNELMAHTYAHLYGLPVTGLRFFTVYGPFGRPDMAYFKFAKAIYEGQQIDVYNHGKMMRDFTYIDDIVEGIFRLIDEIPQAQDDLEINNLTPAFSTAPYRVFNIGNNQPVKLMDFISTLEKEIGKEAKKNFLPMQPGDVLTTYADVSKLEECVGYKPTVDTQQGLANFIAWYKEYYKI